MVEWKYPQEHKYSYKNLSRVATARCIMTFTDILDRVGKTNKQT